MKSCQGCQDRHLGCHSDCEDYLMRKAELDRVREAERADKQNTYTLYGLRIRSLEQSRRKCGKKTIKCK